MQRFKHLNGRGKSCILIPPEKEIVPTSRLAALVSSLLWSSNQPLCIPVAHWRKNGYCTLEGKLDLMQTGQDPCPL